MKTTDTIGITIFSHIDLLNNRVGGEKEQENEGNSNGGETKMLPIFQQ